MTGRMSDNPADSLRRELEAALKEGLDFWWTTSRNFNELPEKLASTLDRCVSAALEAARADERERLQQENQELRAEVERLRNICPCVCGNPRVEFQRGALAVSDGN